jgi:hypothetical protein
MNAPVRLNRQMKTAVVSPCRCGNLSDKYVRRVAGTVYDRGSHLETKELKNGFYLAYRLFDLLSPVIRWLFAIVSHIKNGTEPDVT